MMIKVMTPMFPYVASNTCLVKFSLNQHHSSAVDNPYKAVPVYGKLGAVTLDGGRKNSEDKMPRVAKVFFQ